MEVAQQQIPIELLVLQSILQQFSQVFLLTMQLSRPGSVLTA